MLKWFDFRLHSWSYWLLSIGVRDRWFPVPLQRNPFVRCAGCHQQTEREQPQIVSVFSNTSLQHMQQIHGANRWRISSVHINFFDYIKLEWKSSVLSRICLVARSHCISLCFTVNLTVSNLMGRRYWTNGTIRVLGCTLMTMNFSILLTRLHVILVYGGSPLEMRNKLS